MNKMKLKKVRRWLAPILLTFFVWGIFRWVLFVGYVPTESMEPTIPQKSIVLALRSPKNLYVGDIIIFRQNGKLLVKRATETSAENTKYFVLGDNIGNSFDSRWWKEPYITQPKVFAKVLFVFDLSDYKNQCLLLLRITSNGQRGRFI